MKLWLLKPIEDLKTEKDPWENPYDKCHGFVISAPDETTARELGDANAGDENIFARVWLDTHYSACVCIGTSDSSKIEILLES